MRYDDVQYCRCVYYGTFHRDKGISDAMVDATGGKMGWNFRWRPGWCIIDRFTFLDSYASSFINYCRFVALVARQIILLCLVLAAPLAFVAWLLPNTEKYFKNG